MKTIIVEQEKRRNTYPIFIGEDILSMLKELEQVQSASSLVLITDVNVAKHWLSSIENKLSNKRIVTICISPGEKNKTIHTLEMLWKKMILGGVDRSSIVITIGGGVVSDIGGFAASTYMRGIPVIHIPTTLLAQVDASIGGKTAIDFCEVKNSIGTFHQPSTVIIDVKTLATLPSEQLVSGFAEVVKHGIIADRDFFIFLSKKKIREIKSSEWTQIIAKSLEIKKIIVEQDEEERNGIRKQLNVGHTVGHAVEALSMKSKQFLLHGEAVAIGIAAEAHMSRIAGFLSQADEELIISSLLQWELPIKVKKTSSVEIIKKIRSDKKNNSGTILWTLPIAVGKVKTDIQLDEDVIREGILSIIQ
jgi:3-dehydroquinate synthase